MNNQFIFQTQENESDENYQEGGRKYIVSGLGSVNVLVGFNPHLICPDDNSDLANHIKTDPSLIDTFSTPFSNLEFRKGVVKNKNWNFGFDALIIKNTDQVKRKSEYKAPTQPLTFKVISQKKETSVMIGQLISKLPEGDYIHKLEVEPFSIGIEGLPKIIQIHFRFVRSMSSLQTKKGNLLIETELYNSKLLAESAGKTFTMGVKQWNFQSRKGGSDILEFYDDIDFDLNSFKEVVEVSKENNDDEQETETPQSDNKGNNFFRMNNPVMWISGVTVIGLVAGITLIITRSRRKRSQ